AALTAKPGETVLANLLGPVRAEARNALMIVLCATVVSAAAMVAVLFIAVAVFLWVADAYGTVEACLAMAAFFVLVGLIALAVMLLIQRRNRRIAEQRAAAEPQRPVWLDPAMLPIGIEAARLILRNRSLLVILLGAAAAGWFMTRPAAEGTDE